MVCDVVKYILQCAFCLLSPCLVLVADLMVPLTLLYHIMPPLTSGSSRADTRAVGFAVPE